MPPLPGCKPCFKSPAGPFIFFLMPLDECLFYFFRLRFVCMCRSGFFLFLFLPACMHVCAYLMHAHGWL